MAQVSPKANRKDTCEHVQVEEEGKPGGGLVLRHAGNDGDVDLSVAGVPQRVEPTRPRSNHA